MLPHLGSKTKEGPRSSSRVSWRSASVVLPSGLQHSESFCCGIRTLRLVWRQVERFSQGRVTVILPPAFFTPRWTLQNRPYVDGAKPAIGAGTQAGVL